MKVCRTIGGAWVSACKRNIFQSHSYVISKGGQTRSKGGRMPPPPERNPVV